MYVVCSLNEASALFLSDNFEVIAMKRMPSKENLVFCCPLWDTSKHLFITWIIKKYKPLNCRCIGLLEYKLKLFSPHFCHVAEKPSLPRIISAKISVFVFRNLQFFALCAFICQCFATLAWWIRIKYLPTFLISKMMTPTHCIIGEYCQCFFNLLNNQDCYTRLTMLKKTRKDSLNLRRSKKVGQT